MYKWEYVKGQRAPKAVIVTNRTDGPAPLTVNFSSEGSLDEDPGDSIRFEWDFGDGAPSSIEPNPTHTYSQRGDLTARLTVFRLLGSADLDEHGDHDRQHQPDDHHRPARRGRDVRLRRSDPVRRHGDRSRGRHRQLRRRAGDVRARP